MAIRFPSGRRRSVAILIALVVAAAVALGAIKYWRGRLPPPVAATLSELTAGLEQAHVPDEAALVRSACDRPKDLCDCITLAARHGLDANLGPPTLALIEKSEERCKDRPPLPGMKAEALARVERYSEARFQADTVFRTAPGDMYANLALGLSAFSKFSIKEAEGPIRKALGAGRGAEAHRLLGRIALVRAKYQESRDEFLKVLAARPVDTEAAFTAAMCSANLGRYNDAREGFLRVLRIDPKHVEARYRLAVMTLQVGARMEAEHHLEEFEKIAPNDPRLADLKAAAAQGLPAPAPLLLPRNNPP